MTSQVVSATGIKVTNYDGARYLRSRVEFRTATGDWVVLTRHDGTRELYRVDPADGIEMFQRLVPPAEGLVLQPAAVSMRGQWSTGATFSAGVR